MTGDARESVAPEQRLHPWSWLFVMLQQLKHYLVPLLVPLFVVLFLGGRRESDDAWSQLVILIVLATLITTSILRYLTFRYHIGKDGLTIRSGLLHRNRREIPFTRIHNVGIHQSLLHRLFKVAEVRLESASGQTAEAEMRVLSLPQALALEALIRHHSASAPAAADAAGVAAAATAGSPVLLRMRIPEIVRLGLISNRGMVVAAAAFGFVYQLFPQKMVGTFIQHRVDDAIRVASALHPGRITVVVSAILMLALFLALLRTLSIALAMTRYYGFVLSEDQRRLTIERGLFMRVRTSAPRRRIQTWSLREGPLHRLFRRRNLRVTIAVPQGDENRAFNELAPIATPRRCDELIQHLLPQVRWPPPQWRTLPMRAWFRRFLSWVSATVPLTALAVWHWGPWGGLLGLWLPYGALSSYIHIRRLGYSIDESIVAIRGGWWRRHWRLAELDKIQTLRIKRTPTDRLFGMASVSLHTAGGTLLDRPLHLQYLPANDADELFERLSRMLAARHLR
ncbi:MAG: PH domain-containing protein [Xanthomonadaceae bacterium]|jgi:putative membrane protein|nr:PH domain-containing protein [Xanthomonadaceae bacterium]